MKEKNRKITCTFCGKAYTDRGISRHLTTCVEKHINQRSPSKKII